RMLLGLVAPTGGTMSVLGAAMPDRVADVLPRVGALVEGPAFHPYLSGSDNLVRLDAADRTVRRRDSAERVAAALDRVGLSAAAHKRYRAYSLGMRQRLGLAAALMRPRELLVLDEPTNGLDPQGTREVRHLVHEVAARGTTVFVSSHLLAEVEQMCTHVGVMRTGRLVAQGTLDSLGEALATRVRIETTEPQRAADVAAALGLTQLRTDGSTVSAELGADGSEPLVARLVEAGIPVRQVIVDRPGLEELFVALTGEGFDVDE
ncbi:MAG TPA: ABC transporter ATP-binding protein, partial [Jiangellaceae bacterium]|nr:ABC transporter ATP-binding protein [Jiangellaceae bacterium]